MIIVSQDKETIINFENTTRISIIPPVEKGHKYSIAINGCLDLGYYKTKERAKEIIAEITLAYSNFTYFKTATKEGKDYIINLLKHKYEKFDIYEMPKE